MFGRPHATRATRGLAPTPTGPGGYAAGWRPFPGVAAPHEQIGAYAGQMLNQYPAYVPGIQRENGVSALRSGWYYPSLTVLPNGNLSQTTRPNNIVSGQRYGSLFSGPLGPVNVKAMQAAVTAAQVRQSGVSAMGWAQPLNVTGV